jgi:4-hydroxyphenylacetate 3-monooxygenase
MKKQAGTRELGDTRGARRGEQVLARLRDQRPSLWYAGEPVKDVTTHPAFKGGVQTLAELYDLQWQDPEVSLCESPTTGHKVGRSFMMPRTQEELRSVSKAMKVSADYTRGMMGRPIT